MTKIQTLDDVKRQHVLAVLKHNGGCITMACGALDVSRRSIERWIRQWGAATQLKAWRATKCASQLRPNALPHRARNVA
jgi:transposase-like protein